jgi:Flp pilus assembly pilin Flp
MPVGRFIQAGTSFLRSRSGASFTEYAVALALVGIVTLAALSLLGTTISNAFAYMAGSI